MSGLVSTITFLAISSVSSCPIGDYLLVETVYNQLRRFNWKEIKKVDLARGINRLIIHCRNSLENLSIINLNTVRARINSLALQGIPTLQLQASVSIPLNRFGKNLFQQIHGIKLSGN